MNIFTPEEVMERLTRVCRLGTSVMCRTTFPAGPGKWYVNMKGVREPTHTMDISGSTPQNAIINAWRALTEKSPTLVRYFCKSDEPIPGNGPQVWVRWNHKLDDWEDVVPEKGDSFASGASEILPYYEHRFIEKRS